MAWPSRSSSTDSPASPRHAQVHERRKRGSLAVAVAPSSIPTVEPVSGRAPQFQQTGARVELLGLRKEYGSVVAVADIDLTIEPGEFITLLGPSGSGKTTIMLMIAGFVDP